ncbi:MAG TPA: VanZ family protein [Polyangia bacterium]|nr:VanZ family protein [Polyangia bacterium]
MSDSDEMVRASGGPSSVWLSLLAWLPPILWATLIFVLSAIPGDGLPPLPVAQTDKLIHAAVYLVLGVLCFRALARTTRLGPRAALAAAALLATLYGAGDELHQRFTPGRSPDLADVAADAFGAVAGVLLIGAVKRRRARRRDG